MNPALVERVEAVAAFVATFLVLSYLVNFV